MACLDVWIGILLLLTHLILSLLIPYFSEETLIVRNLVRQQY